MGDHFLRPLWPIFITLGKLTTILENDDWCQLSPKKFRSFDENWRNTSFVRVGVGVQLGLKVYIVDFSLYCHNGKNIFWICICIFLEFFTRTFNFRYGNRFLSCFKEWIRKKMTLLLQKSVCPNSNCLWPLWIFEMQRWKLEYFQLEDMKIWRK